MFRIDECYYSVKYSIIGSIATSIVFSAIFFPFFSYRIGVNQNIIFVVFVVPIMFLCMGLLRNLKNKNGKMTTSVIYTFINIIISFSVVIIMMILFWVTGVLYI